MSDNTYNGWANWETWIINLYFGDDREYIQELAENANFELSDFADNIEEYVNSYIEDVHGTQTGIVSEFVNGGLRSVNWYDLAESWLSDVEIPEEEEDRDDTEWLENEKMRLEEEDTE